jgi:uncharacterized protein with HEPN domain
MTKQPNDSYLRDITDSSALIVEYVKNLTFEEFEKDTMRYLAVSRLLEIIGEATKNLSNDFKAKHPNIPWKKMAGLRDVIIHDYQELNREMIFKISSQDIPKLLAELVK